MEPFSQEHLRTMDCGLFHAPFSAVQAWDKATADLIQSCPIKGKIEDYSVDIKVHMLMPGQYPCIPGWHVDNVPRVNGQQDFSLVDLSQKMYLWVSNEPCTEFLNGKIIPREWKEFTQEDQHRGTVSDKHIWRMFIRLSPVAILPIAPKEQWNRRHSQVYLDADNFKW